MVSDRRYATKSCPWKYIYTLNITTTNGMQYESSPVMMQKVPDIDSLYFKEVTKPGLENDAIIEEKWLDICIDAYDASGQTNYWKWDFEETWEVIFPKDSVNYQPTSLPLPIIKVNVDFIHGNEYEGWDNNKDTCWVHNPSTSTLISSTDNLRSSIINRQVIQSIPPGNDRLHTKYSILVKQMALSKELYEYFFNLNDLNKQNGGMYYKLPKQVFGNIRGCNNDQQVLGYFNASEIRMKRIMILPLQHEMETENPYENCIYNVFFPWIKNWYFGTITDLADEKWKDRIGDNIYSYEPWCSDCRYYGTNVRPDYWEEEE